LIKSLKSQRSLERWEFVEAIAACRDLRDLATLFARMIAEYGYTASACGAFRPTKGGRPGLEYYFRNWPEAWKTLYTQQKFALHDFIIAEARRQSDPYTWLAAKEARRLSTTEKAFWEAVVGTGWADGLSIPIHGPGGQVAFVTMTGGAQRQATPGERARLQCFSILTHDRARALSGRNPEQGPRDLLTSRELDCLRGVWSGKSDHTIGEGLGIARTTVKYHLDRARQKLGVRTRTQAVAQLALWGEA